MSKILRRPMFRGGKVSSYGTGIASGLGYESGGRVEYANGGSSGLDFLKKAFLGPRFTDPNYKSPMQFQSGTGFNFMSPERQAPGLPKMMPGPVRMDELGLDVFSKPATYSPGQENVISASDIEMGEGDLDLTEEDKKGLTEFYEKLKITEKPGDYTGGVPGIDTKKEPKVVGSAKGLTTQQVIEQDAANNDDDVESMINRYEELLGGAKARRRYGENVLAELSKGFLEGEGFRGALKRAVDVKSDEDKIKQTAAMLGIKGEQAKDLYKIKLQNTSGQFQKKVEQIMKAKDLSLEKATNMALGLPGSIDTAVVEWKRKTTGLMTPDDFDLLARGQNIPKLPDVDISQIEDGKYYVPGQKTIVTVKAKEIIDQQPYN